mgnify:CR=1 FL=1
MFFVTTSQTHYVTIADVDYTVDLCPETGDLIVLRSDDNTCNRQILPRPELGSLLCELIAKKMRQEADAWTRRGALYRAPALEI